MKYNLIVIKTLVVITLITVGCGGGESGLPTNNSGNQPPPPANDDNGLNFTDFTLTDTDGITHTLSSYIRTGYCFKFFCILVWPVPG